MSADGGDRAEGLSRRLGLSPSRESRVGDSPQKRGQSLGAMLTIPSHPEHMKLVRGLVAAAAEVVGFEKPDINRLCLAVDEACTNIVRHAYGGDHTKTIEVRLDMHADRMEVALRDTGKKADPAKIKPRALDDIRPGGLGVHFIREIMDEVVYDTSVDVGTEFRMTKRVPQEKRESHGSQS